MVNGGLVLLFIIIQLLSCWTKIEELFSHFRNEWNLFSCLSRHFGPWCLKWWGSPFYKGFRKYNPVYGDRYQIGISVLIKWIEQKDRYRIAVESGLFIHLSITWSRYSTGGPTHPVAHHVSVSINCSLNRFTVVCVCVFHAIFFLFFLWRLLTWLISIIVPCLLCLVGRF